MAQSSAWTVVPDAPPAPAGWTPVKEPDFKQTDTSPNDLPWYSDPSAGAYRKLAETVMDHLPTIAGALGGFLGAPAGPPGAVAGAALGGAAGEAYKQLIRRARGQEAPATPTDAALNIAGQGAGQAAAQATGEVLGPAMTAMGGRLMQSAVKPGVKYLVKAARAGDTTPRVVQTMLDEGINVSPGGVAKLRSILDATNDDIAAALAQSSGRISPLRAASRLSQTAKTFANQVNPQADLDAISAVGENFLTHPSIAGPTISVPEAQALKQGTYARLGGKYGTAGAASIEAEKAIARGLKEEIAAEVPSVSALNAREGKLLEALDVVGKRVALAGNRDPVGFAWAAHNPTTFLAALIDRAPAVKSLLARGLYNQAGAAAKVAPQLIRAAVIALSSGDADAALAATSPDPGRQ